MTTPYAEATRDDPADCRRCGGPLAGDNTTNYCYKCRRETHWWTKEDAALFEAAPKLLAACKALLEAFEGYEMLAALDATVQEQARVAIARAEGEQ